MKRSQFTLIFAAVITASVLIIIFVGDSEKISRPANGSIVPVSLVEGLKHQPSRRQVEKRLGRPIRVDGSCIYYRAPADKRTKQGPAAAKGKEKWINYRWQLCFKSSKMSARLVDRQLYANNF